MSDDIKATQMNWQPIETAPKDGTRFLGVDACISIYWPSVYHFGWETEEGPMWSMADEFFEANLTHWMPLPAHPKPNDHESENELASTPGGLK